GQQRERGADPGEEGALVGEREPRVGLAPLAEHPAREAARRHGTAHHGQCAAQCPVKSKDLPAPETDHPSADAAASPPAPPGPPITRRATGGGGTTRTGRTARRPRPPSRPSRRSRRRPPPRRRPPSRLPGGDEQVLGVPPGVHAPLGEE